MHPSSAGLQAFDATVAGWFDVEDLIEMRAAVAHADSLFPASSALDALPEVAEPFQFAFGETVGEMGANDVIVCRARVA